MKKIKLILFITFIIIFLGMNKSLAKNIEEHGNLDGTYIYNEKGISNVEIKLYKIADFEDTEEFSYKNEFKDFNTDLNEMSISELGEYTTKLVDFIEKSNIESNYITLTDENGIYNFENIDTGIYLMKINDSKDGEYVYTSKPILINIPYFDEIENKYTYSVTANLKVEYKKYDNSGKPRTYDGIIAYVVIVIIAFIMFIISIAYKKIKDGKDDNNE